MDRRVVLLPFRALYQKAHVDQDFQMMRYRGLRHVESLRDFAARQLPALCNLLHHAKARGVRQRLQRPDELAIAHVAIELALFHRHMSMHYSKDVKA